MKLNATPQIKCDHKCSVVMWILSAQMSNVMTSLKFSFYHHRESRRKGVLFDSINIKKKNRNLQMWLRMHRYSSIDDL